MTKQKKNQWNRKATAEAAGVGVETLRFYEQQGLLPGLRRSASGYRLYSLEQLQRLRFIKRAKELGFSLREIKDLLALTHSPRGTPARIRALAEGKADTVRKKIRDLQAIEAVLGRLVRQCSGTGPLKSCPIVLFLDKDTSAPPTRGKGHE
jgi:MerR family transcriptional regulator, copper efflux regulator